MKRLYSRLLADQELRPLLEAGDAIVLKGLAREWKQVERQVEQLGFGDSYYVSAASGREGSSLKISPCGSPPGA